MLIAALALGGIGLTCAVGLGLAAKLFYVEVDPKIVAVEEALPGANCGGCGYAGCSQAAEMIVAGKASPGVCVANSEEGTAEVAGIVGAAIEIREPELANPTCTYSAQEAETVFDYDGALDCRAAILLYQGQKQCDIGCLGLGSCVRACPFDALIMGPKGLPVVDSDKCTGCGTCARICPNNVLTLTSATNRVLAWNRPDECLAPCQRTCPAQIDIPGYIAALDRGRPEEAIRIIKERNPMPLSIGRVCPHPCESVCRRGQADEPVAINHLKRYAADFEMDQGAAHKPYLLPRTEFKVAVVGGGPGGLAAAYYLTRLGHNVTILEAMPKLGGMLRYGIPEYRLPKKTLDWEIQQILDLGVEVKTGLRLGDDFTLDQLKEEMGFDAAFIANGAWNSRAMGVEGEYDLMGMVGGIDWLIKLAAGEEVPMGKKVAIIGGGNTAIDCARNALRMGAEEVSIIYRRTRKEMPAAFYEVDAAEEEGVKLLFLAAPTALKGEEGKLTGIEVIEMELGEPDDSGRRRPVPKEDSNFIIPIDMCVAAIGQFCDLDFLPAVCKIETTRWKTIEANPVTLETGWEGIFAGGDAVSGPATVVEALAHGRKAARAIHYYLRGEEMEPEYQPLDPRNDPWPVITELSGVEPASRVAMSELEPEERRHNFDEVELGISAEQAKTEAARCLQCGLYCYRHQD